MDPMGYTKYMELMSYFHEHLHPLPANPMALLLLRCKQAHLGQLDLSMGDFPAPIITLGPAVDSRILYIRQT